MPHRADRRVRRTTASTGDGGMMHAGGAHRADSRPANPVWPREPPTSRSASSASDKHRGERTLRGKDADPRRLGLAVEQLVQIRLCSLERGYPKEIFVWTTAG